ncbi:Diaphanous GTPase-binding [Penicillium cf. griseofulvum]|uniref:Diaphanous GTPase-binding n=1 Tax=Penicillium cf. griseofulvum TaxID=2972120 RepID=A0A9W9T1L3_9EURO|nr:Diaphanous GTPase-binding [Penicillium cf. griseofulvum]KAJ5441074.1 Diaphanous GTPase-binding [Penicillium cf. griseofulvum]KAJ5449121.1 Diaphanous GTPase-binding [Penicillium cf. griseofulvum]
MAASTSGPHIFDDANRSPTKQSMFRAIMSSKTHKRNQSADDAVAPRPLQRSKPTENIPFSFGEEHGPISSYRPLSEIVPNRDASDHGVATSKMGSKESKGALHKKTKSAVSLKSLRNYMERKDGKSEETAGQSPNLSPKKAKSSNSLSAILKRSQRGRKDGSKQSRDKENRSPTDLIDNMPSPVWSQDSASGHKEPMGRSRPNSTADMSRTVADEVSLYTPKGYGPAQQRNFYDYHQPSLGKSNDPKPRPKSDILTGNRKVKDLFGLQRAPSGESDHVGRPDKEPKRLSRVQAAISVFNAKERDAEVHQHLNSKDLESEFEKLLDARDIPHNMRDKMRSLDTNIKADFIQKDRTENIPPLSAGTGDSRRGRGKESKEDSQPQDRKGSRSRSRSRGFALAKGPSSPGKKLRRDSEASSRRPRSVDLSQPVGVYTTLSANASTATLADAAAVDTAADPSDFVHYLREIQKPEMVEVGKMHKLRLLLRNETVQWVNDFITEGGMDEIVQLLYRIMKMTWREDHEDTLLHEALLCLKALCTTSAALAHLSAIEDELFPALLHMLFDEEKKGPSEFTTRGIIANLLFTQLSTAPAGEPATKRAKQILSYLRDPAPPVDNQPLSFIANIYQSRPYRVWCKEITNVTKEVFWIFLHHLNVIPLPKSEDLFGEKTPVDTRPYSERHFPVPRPPVPAAPYVGGVEWDATNYLAAHLDLVNGLIAFLPTPDERNQLRDELRASGFEKVMGGSLRTCKEKFYSSVHDCLRTWVAAAVDDGWPYTFVREGPPRAGEPGSPTKSPKKSAPGSPRKGLVDERPPRLELALDFSDNRSAAGPITPSSELRSWL